MKLEDLQTPEALLLLGGIAYSQLLAQSCACFTLNMNREVEASDPVSVVLLQVPEPIALAFLVNQFGASDIELESFLKFKDSRLRP